jgi:Spy/CpxP family protein refolding chaperone
MLKDITALLILAMALVLPGAAFAQQQEQPPSSNPTASDQDIQLLRQDIRSQKKQIIAANLQLTDAEATKFWPVYDAYTQETIKINDARYALIKEYAQTYDTMTDVQAKSLIKRWAATDQQFISLRLQWMPKFEAVLPGKKAALFFQLDRRIALLIDLQLASLIPMVKQ